MAKGLKLTEFLPEYEKYCRGAPPKRNLTIIEHTDLVLEFWDGQSCGTRFVIDSCKQRGVPIKIIREKAEPWKRHGNQNKE